ncbi:MAG: DNA polymerase III subunit alpha [Candidatus Shikimatogenerans bostrichidophilus]|nr:MAG: DNA polymerase III subunit alpha [Candidatus Shikimatogenerans bostrichidophilus]
MVEKAIKYNMKAVGITDNNMMGTFNFIQKINSVNKKKHIIKGIIGCEIFIKNKNNKLFSHVLIAKNKKGYYNLIKICSYSFIYSENIYYVKKCIIKKYKKGLIFLTGNLKSEISYYIIKNNIKKAVKILLFWKKIFIDDIYIEIFRNKIKNEKLVNKYLLKFSKKYNILYINQNETLYLKKSEHELHDILLCIKNREKIDTPIGDIKKKGYRFGLPNKSFYFKSYSKIKNDFSDIKKGFINLNNLLLKIEDIKIKKKKLLPNFKIPSKFKKKKKKKKHLNFLYLKYITYKGAKKKYIVLDNNIINRLNKELNIIKKKKFENYFLIVKDIIKNAKKMKIYVGPGRGSVAGSIVAYSIDITKVDPLKHNLIFERFLNIYRNKMPDIDLDIDYKKRNKLISYIIKKYGVNKSSHIITYGKLCAKLAIKDTSRVLNLSLKKANYLCKLIVNNLSLKKILFSKISDIKNKIINKKLYNILKIRNIYNKKDTLESKVLNKAQLLEGIIRNTGVHACGIIISDSEIINNVPVMLLYKKNNKNKNFLITQFDTKVLETIGLLKIDFLGLRTLTVIKETIKKIKKKINFYINDKETYKLFKKGNTIGIFQYESLGMRKYLKLLKPNNFNDLIAINALYRPGPIKYLLNFIYRKNGKEKIVYDFPIMENILKETYGITIYQEQVILIAKKLSGFSESEADILREAIGKKKINKLNKLKKKFFVNSIKNGFKIKKLKKIWKDWEFFASYAFNKSHATCYTYIAFKTAFLKTHYKIEYMCILLSNNLQNYKTIELLLKESKRMCIKFLQPDINISKNYFSIEKKKYIRIGIGAIKGIGKYSIKSILKNRYKKKFSSILDFIIRINLRIINKKSFESLILSGALDSFGIDRYKYFVKKKNNNKIEILIKKISKYKKYKKNNLLNIKKKYKNFFNKKKKIYNNKLLLYFIKEKKILGINIKKNPFLNYKFEINFLKMLRLSNLNKIKTNENILLYGYIKHIDIYDKNKKLYYFILEDDKKNKIKFIINYCKYKKFKYLLHKYYIIVIKYNFFKKKIIYIKNIDKIFNHYNYILIIMYKKNIYNLYKIIINKIEKYFYNKYIVKGDKKIYIIVYNNIYEKKILFKKSILNIEINKINLSFLNKIKNINLFLF